MGTFNPEQFEQIVVDGENQTSMIPVPEGDYEAYIDDYTFNSFDTSDGERVVCNVSWLIDNEDLAEELGLDELRVRQTIWLDLTEAGQIDFGKNKNIGLGRLRAAVGLNTGGFQWHQLQGQVAVIGVKHSNDKDDESIVYANVARVAAKS